MSIEFIERAITDLFSDYGNTAYLRKTKEKSLKKVRGTRLWMLWYGESLTDFCVRTVQYEYKKAMQDNKLMPIFEDNLYRLLSSLKEEFNKLNF